MWFYYTLHVSVTRHFQFVVIIRHFRYSASPSPVETLYSTFPLLDVSRLPASHRQSVHSNTLFCGRILTLPRATIDCLRQVRLRFRQLTDSACVTNFCTVTFLLTTTRIESWNKPYLLTKTENSPENWMKIEADISIQEAQLPQRNSASAVHIPVSYTHLTLPTILRV